MEITGEIETNSKVHVGTNERATVIALNGLAARSSCIKVCAGTAAAVRVRSVKRWRERRRRAGSRPDGFDCAERDVAETVVHAAAVVYVINSVS